ncbi:MAG: hypothetical protein D3M94_07265 [Rhodocyclales bacterium GT-UBC]|nr:MAG: hypothetical protein D3M94_07265 [Rhodocyclales bacterium GT-UBC]
MDKFNEPWGVNPWSEMLIDSNGDNVIGSPNIQRRICACINSCRGLETEELELHSASTLSDGIKLIAVTSKLNLLLAAIEEANECREILGNLIDNIAEHGNYSKESTLGFLDSARQCFNGLDRAIAVVKGGA